MDSQGKDEIISLTTLGALVDHDMRLSVHCDARDCWNYSKIDLVALAARLGRDHGSLAADLRRYFRCSKCGSREVSFSLSSGDTDRVMPGHSQTPAGISTTDSPRRHRRRSRR